MTTKHKSESELANDIAHSIYAQNGGTVAIIGPLVIYPDPHDDDNEIWSVAIVTDRSRSKRDYRLTHVNLGNVMGKLSPALKAAVDIIIEARRPDDLKLKEASKLREQIIHALKHHFNTVHALEDELELARKMEQVWPGEKSAKLRNQIEAERAAQKDSGSD